MSGALSNLFLFRGPVLTVSFAKTCDRPSVSVYIWTPKDTLRLFWSSPSALGGRPLRITLVCGPAACCGRTQNNSDTSGRVAFSMVDGVRHRGYDRNEQIPVIFLHFIKALMLSFHKPTQVRTAYIYRYNLVFFDAFRCGDSWFSREGICSEILH